MSKLHILGSCSGTEPFPDCHHTSWVLEHNGVLYWFDAGECCSHTAYNMGLDLLQTRYIFISHPHMDHVGGLGNLLWTLRKLTCRLNRLDPFDVTLYTPNRRILAGYLDVLAETEDHFNVCFTIKENPVAQGLLLNHDGVTVEAIPNHHIPYDDNGHPVSWSYRISLNGQHIVFSGDVVTVDELAPWLDDCQLLMMETGHHTASEVCSHLKEHWPGVNDVLFLHHGREILYDRAGAQERADKAWGRPVTLARDAMTIELPVG